MRIPQTVSVFYFTKLNMKATALFLSVFLWRNIDCSEPQSEYCQAVSFMCSPKLVTQHTSKHIARWLDKVKAMPDCFVGEERETVEHEDETVEVISLRDGVRSGVAVRYSSSSSSGTEQRYLLGLTLYREGQNVGPEWDLTMGRGYNSSYHFHPQTNTVLSSMQAQITLYSTCLEYK